MNMDASEMGKKGGIARWKGVPKKARKEHARAAALAMHAKRKEKLKEDKAPKNFSYAI